MRMQNTRTLFQLFLGYKLKKGLKLAIFFMFGVTVFKLLLFDTQKCSQGHEIFFGHHQQSPQGIFAHGSYIPAILWQCPKLKDDFWGYFF